MGLSIKDIGKEKAEILIEQGKDSENKVKDCLADVDQENARVLAARKQVAAASSPDKASGSAEAKEIALAQLRIEEKRLADSERALIEAQRNAERITQKKYEQIHKIDQHNEAERFNLEKLSKLKKEAFGDNAAELIEGMARRLNEAEEARAALLRSMGIDAKSDRVSISPKSVKENTQCANGIGALDLSWLNQTPYETAPEDRPETVLPRNLVSSTPENTRDEELHAIEKRLDAYRTKLISLGIPNDADLVEFMNLLHDHYSEELEKKLKNLPNELDESPNFDSIQKLGIPFVLGMHRTLSNCRFTEVRGLYKKFLNKCTVGNANHKGGAYYIPGGGVHFNKDSVATGDGRLDKPFQVAFHEFGHNIDYLIGKGNNFSVKYNNNELYQAICKDFETLRGNRTNQQLIDDLKREKIDNNWTMSQIGNVSDVLESMTRIDYPLGVGHGSYRVSVTGPDGKPTTKKISYWERVPANVEFFAEVLDSAASNEESYLMMKRFFPTAVAVVHKMIEEVAYDNR